MLTADLLLEINVFFLQPRLQCGDLLIRPHVLNRQGDLIGHFLQELRVRVGVPILVTAGHVESTDALCPEQSVGLRSESARPRRRGGAQCHTAALFQDRRE